MSELLCDEKRMDIVIKAGYNEETDSPTTNKIIYRLKFER